MVHVGYIVEQAIYSVWTVVLSVLYAGQNLKRPTISELRTAHVIHIGGLCGVIVCDIWCVDPFNVWHVYDKQSVSFISYSNIVILLTTALNTLCAMLKKMNVVFNNVGSAHINAIYCINCTIIIAAVVSWYIGNFVTNILVYSVGVYFTYITGVLVVVYAIYMWRLGSISQHLRSIKPTITEPTYHTLRSILHKLNMCKYLYIFVVIAAISVNSYTIINQMYYTTEASAINSDCYSFMQEPLLAVVLISYTILLYISYSKKEQVGISDASTCYSRTNVLLNVENGVTLPMCPNIVISASVVISDVTGEPGHNQVEQDKSYSGSSMGDILPGDVEKIMQHIAAQDQAERDGKLDEFLNKTDGITADTLPGVDTQHTIAVQNIHIVDNNSPRVAIRNKPKEIPSMPLFYEDMIPGPGLPSIPSAPSIPLKFNERGKQSGTRVVFKGTYVAPPSLPASRADLTDLC